MVEKAKRKTGPKPLPADHIRSERVVFMLTPREQRSIYRLARSRRLSVSTQIRELVLRELETEGR